MDLLLMVLVLLWSSGLQAEGNSGSTEPVRLVGGASRCEGSLEVMKEDWRPVAGYDWTLKNAAVVCRDLDCGSAVSIKSIVESSRIRVWLISSECVQSGSTLRNCSLTSTAFSSLHIICSDSVRLMNGTSSCSGRLEVRTHQSNQQWSLVCVDDFDQQDAQVVCRQLGCGPPSVLQGALYREVEAPVWSRKFQCGGRESSLLNCGISGSARTTCSPGRAAGLTCSEPVRLVGGESHCAGSLEVMKEEWRPVSDVDWSLKEAAIVCRDQDCGSAVSLERKTSSLRHMWRIKPDCVQSGSTMKDCSSLSYSLSPTLHITCSDSVRLVGGTSSCSGRLEVRTHQSNQQWSLVCVYDFDQQDAQVVCRQLGCGPPSVLQGALYGEVEAPVWSREFQCGGNESSLLNCSSSGSARTTCSPGRAAGLTCSEPVRLVGGESRCAGSLEVKQQKWRPVMYDFDWSLKEAAVVCRDLDCGSAVSLERIKESSDITVWRIEHGCIQSGSTLRDCSSLISTHYTFQITCSGPTVLQYTVFIIRLVVLPLSLLLVNTVVWFILKATRGKKPVQQENMEPDNYNLGVIRAEGGPVQQEEVQAAE